MIWGSCESYPGYIAQIATCKLIKRCGIYLSIYLQLSPIYNHSTLSHRLRAVCSLTWSHVIFGRLQRESTEQGSHHKDLHRLQLLLATNTDSDTARQFLFINLFIIGGFNFFSCHFYYWFYFSGWQSLSPPYFDTLAPPTPLQHWISKGFFFFFLKLQTLRLRLPPQWVFLLFRRTWAL